MAERGQRRNPSRTVVERDSPGRDPLESLLEAIAATLVLVRLLIPPEGSVLGLTLWVTQSWFAAGLILAWVRYRNRGERLRFDLLDAGVWLIVAAHVISALRVVVMRDGHPRAALNMLWEWLALGVSFVILRGLLRETAGRRRWVAALVGLAIAVGGLGLWQHYVWYPSLATRYESMRTELEELKSGKGPGDEFTRSQRMRALQKEFLDLQIPTEGPAVRQWEDRLRGSSEPIGLFALANSLAGWLDVWLIVGAGAALQLRRLLVGNTAVSKRSLVLLGLGLGVIAFCLLLTKSRTGWVGLMAGLAAWGVAAFWKRRASGPATEPAASPDAARSRRWIGGAAVGAVLLALAFAVAAFSGGFDRRVISEAPKSLKYRLQYWVGATAIVRESPVLGVGPGSFRGHYLKHKLPEASEEIADPHNFLFDLWTSGGIFAVIGLAIAVWGGARAARADRPDESSSEPSTTGPTGAGMIAGFVLFAMTDYLFASPDLGRTVSLGAAWLVLMWLLGPDLRRGEVTRGCLAGALVAMFVHLLGAGGIEMPAIVQTLLLLAALIAPSRAEAAAPTDRTSLLVPALQATLSLVMFVACLTTATLPVAQRDVLMSRGDTAVSNAESYYAQAAAADPFSPDPPERLADALLRRGRVGSDTSSYDKAVEMQQIAIELDPHNGQRYRRMAEVQRAAFRDTRDAKFADGALKAYEQSIARYPNYAPLHAEYADALTQSGRTEDAAREAARAIELDDINRHEGHADKIFPDDLRKKLEALAG